MIAQIHSPFGLHERRIWVGGADVVISHALIAAAFHAAILCFELFDPVKALDIVLGEFLTELLGDRDRK